MWAQQDSLPSTPTTALGALIVALLVALSALGWILRHVLSVMIPNLVAAFEKSEESRRIEHKEALGVLIASHRETVATMIEHHERQCATREKMAQVESTAMLRAIQDQGVAIEELVKEIRQIKKPKIRKQPPPTA